MKYRRMFSKHNLNNSSHSINQYSIKRTGYEDGKIFKNKLKRSKKFSEDFGSQGNLTNEKIIEVASNSSLVPS